MLREGSLFVHLVPPYPSIPHTLAAVAEGQPEYSSHPDTASLDVATWQVNIRRYGYGNSLMYVRMYTCMHLYMHATWEGGMWRWREGECGGCLAVTVQPHLRSLSGLRKMKTEASTCSLKWPTIAITTTPASNLHEHTHRLAAISSKWMLHHTSPKHPVLLMHSCMNHLQLSTLAMNNVDQYNQQKALWCQFQYLMHVLCTAHVRTNKCAIVLNVLTASALNVIS